MAANEVSVLQTLFSTLVECLNVETVKPYLVSNQTINLDECEELQVGSGPQLTTQRAVAEKLIMILKRKPRCASQLLDALENANVQNPDTGHHQLMALLKEKLSGIQVVTKADSNTLPDGLNENLNEEGLLSDDHPSSNPGASNEPLPLMNYKYLDSPGKEKLRVKLASESRKMLENFTTFVVDVSSLLQSKSVSSDQVQLALQYRLGNIDDTMRRRIDEASEVDEARRIPLLLRIAEPFSSWYNYDLIAYIAKCFGGKDGEALVSKYEDQLQSYFKKLVYECPPFSSIQKVPNGFDECVVKVHWNYRECTVQDLTILKEKLSNFLEHDPNLLILKTVDEGCILFSWIVPVTAVPAFQENVLLEKSNLAKERIVSFKIGAEVIEICEKEEPDEQVECHSNHQQPGEMHTTSPLTIQQSSSSSSVDKREAAHEHEKKKAVHLETQRVSPLVHSMKAGPSPDSPPPRQQQQRSDLLRTHSSETKTRILPYQAESLGYHSPTQSQRSSTILEDVHSRFSSGYNSQSHSQRSSWIGESDHGHPQLPHTIKEEEQDEHMVDPQHLKRKLSCLTDADPQSPVSDTDSGHELSLKSLPPDEHTAAAIEKHT